MAETKFDKEILNKNNENNQNENIELNDIKNNNNYDLGKNTIGSQCFTYPQQIVFENYRRARVLFYFTNSCNTLGFENPEFPDGAGG